MDEEHENNEEDLRQELEALGTGSTLSDKEAEERFIAWYEDICQERMAMLAAEENYKNKINELETAEEGYKSRVQELENSTNVLVKTFEEAQSEIRSLRTKYEPRTDNNLYLEPYHTVTRERDNLLKSESENKRRIKELETEVKQLRNYVKGFSHEGPENNKLRRTKDVGQIVVVTSSERLNALERENENLKNKLERMKHKNKSMDLKAKNTNIKEQKTTETKSLFKKEKSLKTPREKQVINKKCIPTFLPRIENKNYSLVSETKCSKCVPFLQRSSQTPTLMFGLGYSDIYRKVLLRSRSVDSTLLSSSQFDSISKYMI